MNVHIGDISYADGQKLERCASLLRANHDLKLSLCDALEAIADGLPDQLDSQACLTLSRCVLPTLRKSHTLEEEEVFPLLSKLTSRSPQLLESLERLRREHCEDEGYGEEIAALLEECAHKGQPDNPESAGYMLRGFFTGLRRHVAFERECLMPLAGKS
jgi:hemerythrin-like domain-containing protein